MAKIKDMTGKIIGKLTVKEFAGMHIRGKRSEATWLCECECGG